MAEAKRRHRPIPDLIGDTFGVVARRFREVAVVAIVAAALAVISVAAFTAGVSILEEEIADNPKFVDLLDLLSNDGPIDVTDRNDDVASEYTPVNNEEVRVILLNGDDARSEAFDAFVDSVDWDRVVNAVLLIGAALLTSLMGWSTTIAFSLVALDDVEDRPSAAGRALGTGLARIPKAILLAVLYVIAALSVVIGLGLVVVVASLVHSVIGLLVGVAGIGVFIAVLVYFMPLTQLHFVMAYVEPGFPSPARWWRMMSGAMAATWGRVVLILGVNIVAGLVLWAGLRALPSPYGDFISNAIAGPIITALSSIAFVLMYADLSGRSQPSGDSRSEPIF